jgi:hypothetical protein
MRELKLLNLISARRRELGESIGAFIIARRRAFVSVS